jgi:Ni,Fe-hydrogenase I small subunit
MRITRRDFLKYCATAAGALGLTATDLGRLEKALATSYTDGGTQVVWLNGAACTGCTVSLANTAYYASIQDLLVPWGKAFPYVAQADPNHISSVVLSAIGGGYLTDTATNGALDLVFMETLSSAVGSQALNGAKSVLSSSSGSPTAPFVLCIEGAIQTASSGNYCRIGDGAASNDTTTITFANEVLEYATDANCLAILAVGTCASFGGIPAAKGSVTGARGLISTGTISGGYTTVNTTGYWDYLKANPTGALDNIRLTALGAGYTGTLAVGIGAPPIGGTPAVATGVLNTFTGSIASVTITNAGAGYTSAPAITFSATGGPTTVATAVSTLATQMDTTTWESLMRKTICVSGCPPHPDWIVGMIVYLVTYSEPPTNLDKYHRPMDYYGSYQCTNCIWQTNDPGKDNTGANLLDIMGQNQSIWSKGQPAVGNSPRLYRYKYDSQYEGCIGILGCKGRKTKADCSYRRWNSDTVNSGGVAFCVQTRAGCHGCTEPRFPDGWGKFFSYK